MKVAVVLTLLGIQADVAVVTLVAGAMFAQIDQWVLWCAYTLVGSASVAHVTTIGMPRVRVMLAEARRQADPQERP